MTRQRPWIGIVVAVLAAVAAGAAVGAWAAQDDGVTPTTVRIGVEGEVGSLSLDGENLGFRLAFEEANAAGGVHGRRLAWTDRRRASGAPADVLAVARRMVDEDRVFALVNFSGPAIADIAALARTRQVPLLFPHTALISSQGERFVFTSFPRFEVEADVMLRYLAKDRGVATVAIAHDPNAYGLLFRDLVRARAARFGYTVAAEVPIAARVPGDVSREWTALTAPAPQAIVMALYPEQAQVLMAARARAGWRGTMVSTGPLTDEASLAVPGGSADGTLGFCHSPDPATSEAPGVARYRTALARFHPERRADRYTLYGYTYGRLVLEGLTRAGRDLTRPRFLDAMESIAGWDAGGVMPDVTFSPSNHHAQRAGFICEMRSGRLAPLTGWIG